MKIAVLGTGMVGQTLAAKLVALRHEVMMGARSQDNEKAKAFASKSSPFGLAGDFRAAAAFGELIFNCTQGTASLSALALAGEEALDGKVLIDVSNPLDFGHGTPPTLTVANTDSLGEQIQRTFPKTKVVKALNTMWCGLMVDPRMLPEDHAVFLAGNDNEAKDLVRVLLRSFGWKPAEMIDLGDITASRGTEGMLPLWLRIWGNTKNGAFNFRIVSS
jgi:predicted dinucleotide-binding enzyme